ncbi:MAG: hypothetical protein AAF598_09790 [Bacteroidota bacterium]
MRILKIILWSLLAIILVGGFLVYNTLSSTGYFRKIEPIGIDQLEKRIPLWGVEDITVSYTDSFAILSATDRSAERMGREKTGDLYLLDLKNPDASPINVTEDLPFPFFPHGISMYRTDSTYYIAAINHSDRFNKGTGIEHSVEIFEKQGDRLVHIWVNGDGAISPNDLVLIGTHEYFYTNDHGPRGGFRRFLEDFGGIGDASVSYYADKPGSIILEKGLAYANGINVDPERQLLFVTESRAYTLKVYQIISERELKLIETIDCGTGVDNIEIASDGKLWIGCHPSLMHFANYAKGKDPKSPSEVITVDYRGKGDYTIETVFLDDGRLISSSSVAAPFGDQYLIGTVADSIVAIVNQ